MAIIKTKNLELTDAIETLIERKIGALKRFIKTYDSPLSEFFVEVEKETKHHRKGDVYQTEIILMLPGKKLVAKAKGSDFSRTVLEARDEMKMEIQKYKARAREVIRREQRKNR